MKSRNMKFGIICIHNAHIRYTVQNSITTTCMFLVTKILHVAVVNLSYGKYIIAW